MGDRCRVVLITRVVSLHRVKSLRIAISRACTCAVNIVWRRHHKRWLHCTYHPCKCIGPDLRIAVAKVRPDLVGCVEPIIREIECLEVGATFCFYRNVFNLLLIIINNCYYILYVLYIYKYIINVD